MEPKDLGLPEKFEKFFDGQLENIVRIVGSDKPFVAFDSPTGSGKSVTAIGSGQLSGKRYLVLVSTKSLQKQYLDDFPFLVDIRGRSNYPCSGGYENCKQGYLEGCEVKCCNYREHVHRASQAKAIISNYAYFITINKLGLAEDGIGFFDYIICDEAHLVALDLLSRYSSIDIYKKSYRKWFQGNFPSFDTLEQWVDWASHCRLQLMKIYRDKRDEGATKGELTRIKDLGKSLADVANLDIENTHWVFKSDRYTVTFTPVNAQEFADKYLFPGAEKVLFMSATLNTKMLRYLGVKDNDECEFISNESNFSPERRPFYYYPVARIDSKTQQSDMWRVVTICDMIIEKRLAYKGIIHTTSYDRARLVLDRSKWKEFMISNLNRDTDEVLEEYRDREPPCILVSPSVVEGHDFKYDQARWQIMMKVPFVSMKDPLVKARSKYDKDYSTLLTSNTVLQTVGRIMRSVNDFGETFILDMHWGNWFSRKAKSMGLFPKYFIKAWKTIRKIPEFPKEI